MSFRRVITDAMWDRIEPLMPADPAHGRPWADHRRTLEAIAWKYRTRAPWRHLPDELGSFQTAHRRLIRWATDGTWERVLTVVLTEADTAVDDIAWTVPAGRLRPPGPSTDLRPPGASAPEGADPRRSRV